MVVALDASTPAFISAAADTVTTASFTPPAGSVIFAVAFHDTAGGNTTNSSLVTDSQGLTWTIDRTRNRADVGGQNGHVQLSWAVVTSSVATTVTTTGTNCGGYCSLRALVFTGADTTTPIDTSDEGSTTSNVASMTLTTLTDLAWAWMALIDWNTAAVPTAGTGITVDTGTRPGAPNYTVWVAHRTTDTSPPGAVTINTTAPSTGNTNNFVAWAIKPAAGSGTTPSGTDGGTFAEAATVNASAAGVDSGALSEAAAISVIPAGSDSGTLTDVSALTVQFSVTDGAVFSDTAVQVQLVMNLSSSDGFTFTDSAASPNPNSRLGLTTLTYHLNRLAGTLVGGTPSLTAVAAANVWAGTSKLSLEDALNEKAGDSVPTLDVAGALNKIAGTNDLTPVDAISRIP